MATFRNLTSPGTVYAFSPGVPAALPGWVSNGSPDGVMINDAKSLHGLSGANALAATRQTVVADIKMNSAFLTQGNCHFVLGSRYKGKSVYVGPPDNCCGAAVGGNLFGKTNMATIEVVEGALTGGGWVNRWPIGSPENAGSASAQISADQFYRFVIETAHYPTSPGSCIALRVFNQQGQKVFDSGENPVWPNLFSPQGAHNNVLGEYIVFAKIFQAVGQTMWAKSFKSTWTGPAVRVSDAEIVALGSIA